MTCDDFRLHANTIRLLLRPKSSHLWDTVKRFISDVFSIDIEAANWNLPLSICVMDSNGRIVVDHIIDRAEV